MGIDNSGTNSKSAKNALAEQYLWLGIKITSVEMTRILIIDYDHIKIMEFRISTAGIFTCVIMAPVVPPPPGRMA